MNKDTDSVQSVENTQESVQGIGVAEDLSTSTTKGVKKPVGLIPSLPLSICLTWYILALVYGIICTFIPTNFTINVRQDSTGIGLVYFRMMCNVVQAWLWVIALFGGISTFFRKELNTFYSGYTIFSIFVVVITTLGFIGG